MHILALDTSTAWVSVAVFDGQSTVAIREHAGNASSERILPLVTQLLADAGTPLSSLAGIAFGAGPHFCAGAWASRAMVADVALPAIFARLKGLRLVGAPRIGGWAFRGLIDLPVTWDG